MLMMSVVVKREILRYKNYGTCIYLAKCCIKRKVLNLGRANNLV